VSIAELERKLSTYSGAGYLAPLGGVASLHAEGGSLRGAAWSHGGGFFHRSTDNIVLRSFRAGADRGLLLAICAGNYKDEACCFASAAAACAFVEAFEGALISEADVVPALRSAMLGAHEGIVDLSGEPIGDLRLGTTVGGRTSLKGLGAMVTAVAAVAGRLWVVHIGDCRAYLIREGCARKLTIEHTLSHAPEYRERIEADPEQAIEWADDIVLRVLGVSEDPPKFDVSRMDLRPRDRLLVGTAALTNELAAMVASLETGDIDAAGEALTPALSAARLPVTFGIIDVRQRGNVYR
jgi:hypothetical protein